MITFGILQGRLSPAPAGRPQAFPWSAWSGEFAQAAAIGFSCIEWLVTAERPDDNPLLTTGGVEQIRRAAAAAGVAVSSVCADCFIPAPLVGAAGEQPARAALLDRIVRGAAALGARQVVLPLLEGNAPADEADAAAVLSAIAAARRRAAAAGMRIALETSWPGARVRRFLDGLADPSLGVCYDIGNAAAFEFRAGDDLRALGSLVGAVHVKDRRRNGGSVPLGNGDADLAGAFAALEAIGYAGPAILETPAGRDPVAQASRNLAAARRAAGHAVTPA